MFFYDWTFIILIPGILIALFAQIKVKSAFTEGNKIQARSGVSSNEVASAMIRHQIGTRLPINRSNGMLSDHYNPMNKTLSLSDGVYGRTTISAIAVAAHEAGHAIQDAEGYFPLRFRSAIVPIVQFSSSVSPIIILAGFALYSNTLINIGIIAYALTLLFTLVTLPVEFDASKRAKLALVENNYLTQDEMKYVNHVLDAAALTYVAAAITSLLHLIRLLILRPQRDD